MSPPRDRPSVRRVGLTGGIAAGKSTAARRLAALGAGVVDHDVLAREVVGPGTPGLAEMVAAFGRDVVGPDGALDRAAVADVVFADPARRARLEEIVHPRVRAAARDREAGLAAAGHRVVVHDIPLLVETGQHARFDDVVVVVAPEGVRMARLADRGLTPEAARARLAAQASDERRRAVATVVLDGSGPASALERAVDELWNAWSDT